MLDRLLYCLSSAVKITMYGVGILLLIALGVCIAFGIIWLGVTYLNPVLGVLLGATIFFFLMVLACNIVDEFY